MCAITLDITHHALQFRGRGIASNLLSALAHSPHGAEAVSIIACPHPTGRIDNQEAWAVMRSVAVNLFLKV